MRNSKPYRLGGAIKPGEEEGDISGESLTTVFVEQPLALPGSAKNSIHQVNFPNLSVVFCFLAHNNNLSVIEFPQCKQLNWFHAVNLCSLPSIETTTIGEGCPK